MRCVPAGLQFLFLGAAAADALGDLCVSQYDARISLQGGNIALAEFSASRCGNQQEHRLRHDRVHIGVGQLLGVEGFVDGDNQLRDWPQPGEKGIAGEKLEKVIRRLNTSDILFVDLTLRVEQRFVEFDQGAVELDQRLSHLLLLGSWLCRIIRCHFTIHARLFL
jgi:hypothetical protein